MQWIILAIIGLTLFGSLLWAVHEAVVYTLLRRGGVQTTAFVHRLRVSRSNKSINYYATFSYQTLHRESLSKEQSISAGLYRRINDGDQEIRIRYLPGKPKICRVWETEQPHTFLATSAILVVVIGIVFIGPIGDVIFGRTQGAFFLSLLGGLSTAVIGALGFYSHYAKFADLKPRIPAQKAKQPPAPTSFQAFAEDDPFAVSPEPQSTSPQKAKNAPSKAKRTPGFTPLDDDPPLI